MKTIIVNCKDPQKHELEVSFALSELKKQMKKEGIMQELRRREHYLSPSKTRKRKREDSLKRRIRDEKKQERIKNSSQE